MYLLLSLVLFLTPLLLASSLPSPSNPNAIPGKYIVQLQPSTSVSSLAAHHSIVRRLARRHEAHEPIERVFSIGTLNAYLGDFDADAVAQVEALEEVASVEADEYIYLENTNPPIPNEKNQEKRALITETNSLWSLADLSHAEAGATSYVYDDSAGAGMTAYVFDTGIRLSHEQFEGRARFGINAILNSTDPAEAGNDQDGHGTHCAATIVGKTFGVARKAEVVDVKVFDGAVGSTSAILTGLQWAITTILNTSTQTTSVLSLSLSSRTSSTLLDTAIASAHNAGILSVVAAGNENQPISDTTPARVPQAFTVGMTQRDRSRVSIIQDVYGSNYGPEMDVFAPGRDIVSASHESDTGSAVKTGTSMATPLVAGLVCYLRGLEKGLGTPQQVTGRILELALKGVVGDARASPNLLVQNGSGR